MKKILLALAVLVGSILPSMAQNYGNKDKSNSTTYCDTEYERYRENKIDDIVQSALDDFLKYGNLDSSVIDLIPFLLKGSDDSLWRLIHDSTVKKIINASIDNAHSVDFIKFLIDNDMPESEIDRYIDVARVRMNKVNRIFKKFTPGNNDPAYETCTKILELLEQTKTEIDRNIEQILIDSTQAQDCDREWNYWAEKGTTPLIEELIHRNDLECLEYYVDVKGYNLNDVEMPKDESLINLVFSSRNAEPEILSFLINHGIKLKDNDMNRIAFWMRFLYDDECDLFFRNFKILINEYPDAWKKISDSSVRNIVRDVTFAKDPIRATKLLLDNKLPVSEYNRYIKSAEEWVKEVKRDRRKIEGVAKYNKQYSIYGKWIEAGETFIALLNEKRHAEFQPVHENLGKVLNKSTEENLTKIEEETQKRYNHQF